MGNEVVIEVSAVDATAATKDELKASWKAFEKSFQPLGLKAMNPIDDAFMAEVKASLKAISKDALQIPVDADTAPFLEELESVLRDLSMTSKADIPIEVGDALEFRSQVRALVDQVSASTKAVIDIEVNDTGLSDLQQKAIAAQASTMQMVSAQQKLDQALASGDEERVAKARQELASATLEADRATTELQAVQEAAAVGADALAESEKAATVASAGLGDAMGPLWMVMNAAQMAMFAFGFGASSSSSQAQDLSQQIVGLGSATGQTALSLLGGNQALQNMSGQLSTAGTTAAAFSQAFDGGSASMRQYRDALNQQLATLGAMPGTYHSAYNAMGRYVQGGVQVTQTTKDIAGEVNRGSLSLKSLPQPVQDAVNRFNALGGVLPQVSNALTTLEDAEKASQQAAAALGFAMTSAQTSAQDYGSGIQAAAKTLMDATAGSTYLEDATDKAAVAAGEGVQQWRQLQQAVSSAQQSYQQAGEAVTNAQHSVVTAGQGVASARHAEQQATEQIAAAQQAYQNALYQEEQAQESVTAARKQAQQALVDLQLQADDAATGALSANANLFDAQQAAAKLGVTPGNAQQIASEQINAANEAQVKAAIALIQAENQVADAQNSSANAQSDLNTARQQGIDNNPQVLAAEHALAQAQQGVKTASEGVTNAEYAQQQAAIAVSNAEWGLREAHVAVRDAERQRTAASVSLREATEAESRSTDQNTMIGAQNRQMIEKLFQAYVAETGNEQIAAQMTQQVGQQMHFTSGHIADVIGSLTGLNGMSAQFSLVGTPSINPQQLVQVGQELGLSFSDIGKVLPNQGSGRAKAVGGPAGGLVWVGEQGAELVHLPPGSEVLPHANSMQRVALGEVEAPGYAAGGPVGAGGLIGKTLVGANLPIAAQWGALDVTAQMLHALGGPAPKLPAAGSVDWGAFGNLPGSVPNVPSSRAANEAAVQGVFSGYGWGSGPEWDAAVRLIMMESGFNNTAQNPTSTAYGIFQFLNSTWGNYGIQKTSDPTTQAVGGARYIGARYHDPLGALAHENVYHWYGSGGGATGTVGVGERGPELVRLPSAAASTPAGPARVDVNVNFVGNTDSAAATWLMNLVRTGQIQLTAHVNGQQGPVKAG